MEIPLARTSEGQSGVSGRRLNQLLLQAALLLIIAILAGGIYLVSFVVSHQGMPSTYSDAVMQDTRAAFESSPRDATAVADYARALTLDGQLSKASSVIQEFRSEEATSPAPVVTVEEARIEWKRGNADEALLRLETAVAECDELREFRREQYAARGIFIEPKMPEIVVAQLLRARILEEGGRFSEAAEALTVALTENPMMADVLTQRGDLFARLGSAPEARADYERALQMIPDYSPALQGLEALDD